MIRVHFDVPNVGCLQKKHYSVTYSRGIYKCGTYRIQLERVYILIIRPKISNIFCG